MACYFWPLVEHSLGKWILWFSQKLGRGQSSARKGTIRVGVWVPGDDSSIIADTAVGVAVAMTALTPRPPGTWLLHQYRTGNRSAHPSASAHEVTSLRPEEVSFGRTAASRRLNLSFHELCPLPRHTPHPRIPRWYF